MIKSIFAAALATLISLSPPANAASSVDGSLDEIAQQIIERTKTDGTPTIGISTFTHGDGTCSDLSNYITEFIVDSLFNAGQGSIDIIERSQLSAIFREMELVFDGTIAPDAAKRLGEIEGVDAVVTGSLIQFGEQVKLQARLISTQNGRLFATARSDFPSVGSVAQMMAARSRAQCGFTAADGSATAPQTTTEPAQATGLATPSHRFSSDAYDAEVSSLIYAKSRGETSFAIRFKNTSKTTVALSYVPKTLSVSDGIGGFMQYKDGWNGLRGCEYASRLQNCNSSDPLQATSIAPGKVVQLHFVMQGEKGLADPQITLLFELVVTPDTSQRDSYSVQPVSFYDMAPKVK